MSRYYVCDVLPEPFRAADELMAKLYPEPEYVEPKIKYVPPPDITRNYGANGPLHVTKDWYRQACQEREERYEVRKKQATEETIKLLVERDRLNAKIGKLDPRDKKDCKKIAKLNIKLQDVKGKIDCWVWQYELDLDEIEHGSFFDRVVGRVKRAVKKTVKKAKKIWKANQSLFTGILGVVIPAVGAGLVRKLLNV